MNISVNGLTLFYEKNGSGPPLLLLHGNGEDHHVFDRLSAKLQHHRAVYAIDSRGHGDSDKTDVYSYEAMAEDIYRFIERLGLPPVDIVGFSDGAIVALLLAMRHRETVRKMALLGVNLQPSDFTAENFLSIKASWEATGDPLLKLMLEQPHIELDEVKTVSTPTLLVAAEHDLYRPELFTELAQAMPNATLKIMAGHGHDTYIVGQDILYPDLIEFFTGEAARRFP